MAARDWTTVQLVHRSGPATFDARNPFPPGGVYEDPATGAAAAAFGAYLAEIGTIDRRPHHDHARCGHGQAEHARGRRPRGSPTASA